MQGILSSKRPCKTNLHTETAPTITQIKIRGHATKATWRKINSLKTPESELKRILAESKQAALEELLFSKQTIGGVI